MEIQTNESIVGVCFWITTKCNLKCDICYADLNSVKDNTTNGYLQIINKLSSFNIKKISFTGGDPLLINNLDIVLAKAKEKDIKVALTTNATLMNLQKLKNYENLIDEMSIPMDGFSEKISAIHRTNKHNHNNVKNIIELSSNYNIKIDVSTVISKFNKHEILNILDFLVKNKIYKWKCFQYSELNKSIHTKVDFNISNNDFNKVIESINNKIHQYKYNIQVDFRDNSSISINSYINLLPNGEILLSEDNQYIKIGNILKFDNLSDLIHKLKSEKFSFLEHNRRHFRDI